MNRVREFIWYSVAVPFVKRKSDERVKLCRQSRIFAYYGPKAYLQTTIQHDNTPKTRSPAPHSLQMSEI